MEQPQLWRRGFLQSPDLERLTACNALKNQDEQDTVDLLQKQGPSPRSSRKDEPHPCRMIIARVSWIKSGAFINY